MWKYLCLCFILASITTTGDCQLQRVMTFLSEREDYFRQYRLEWRCQEKEISPPQPPIQVQQEVEELKRQMLARGVKDSPDLQKHLADLYSKEVAGEVIKATGIWTVEWGGESGVTYLFVSGERGGGIQTPSCWRILGEGWGMELPTDPKAPTFSPILWCCTGECIRYPCPAVNGLNLSVDELSVIACLNPLRIAGGDEWSIQRKNDTTILLRRKKQLDTYGFAEVTLAIDVSKGYLVRSVTKTMPDFYEKLIVLSARQVGKYWIPHRVETKWGSTHRYGMKRERVWTLQAILPPKTVALSSIAGLRSVRERGISDFRLAGCDLTFERRTRAMDSGQVVTYAWKGKIPDLKELEALSRSGHRQEGQGVFIAFLRLAPPLLLIAIGLWWYWRLRRSGGA